jgi:polyisoprenoid-binding protein YceI
MKLRIIGAVILLAGFNLPSLAGETYKFEPSRSTVGFSIHQFLGVTYGKFTKFDGKIEIDREHPDKSSVTARIDVHSIDTGIAKRDDHLRSSEFFNVEKYPEIAFKSRSVRQTGPQAGDIMGDLNMHGVTKPITLHVKLLTPPGANKQARWSVATDPLNRRDFNLMFSQAAEAMSGVGQAVAINIEIEATRVQ